MRLALYSSGFASAAPGVDLRLNPEDTQDTLFFLTTYAGNTNGDVAVFSTNAVDDQVEIILAPVGRYAKALDRLPMRGPLKITTDAGNTQTGYLELENSDQTLNLQPLTTETPEAPYTILPLVFDTTESGREVCVIPDATVNLTLFVAAGNAADQAFFHYGALGYRGDPEVTTGFVKVMDRIPVTGPGTVTVDVTIATGPVVIYGYLSS